MIISMHNLNRDPLGVPFQNKWFSRIDQTNKHNGGNSARIAIAVNAWNGEEADEQLTIN